MSQKEEEFANTDRKKSTDDKVEEKDAANVGPTKKASSKKTSRRKKSRRSASTKSSKKRRSSAFPASSFEEALTIPLAIQRIGSGTKVRRLTLFDSLRKSPESSASRMLITNASKYGLIKGSYKAEYLELTDDGNIATSNDNPERNRLAAQFRLAIETVPAFKLLYEQFCRNRLPAVAVLEDTIRETIPENDRKECVETFIVNARFVRVLRTVAGAERLLPLEQALEELPTTHSAHVEPSVLSLPAIPSQSTLPAVLTSTTPSENWDEICFYIAPIGDEGSERRNHSDLFLGSVVEPALEEFKLRVVRADQIGKPGMIGRQIIEYILRAKLVLADLSYHNPNVFYELSLRHVCRLPTVQIIRKMDDIPFDLDQFRTIQIDTTNIFTLVPNLQSYKAQIATQVRAALKDPDSVDNPLTTYYPDLRVSF